MANSRKIQGEIDKLLKKISDNMDVYDAISEKVESATDRLQKEKFESELKKEIKKLQRLREAIKGLVASPEVKDKKALETSRRDIEVKMEQFKITERETKTKAFSREGLAAGKSDPAERAKQNTIGWIRNAISSLNEQIEQIEFDIEAEGGSKKKKGGKLDDREVRLLRSKFHITKLEQLLRILVNDDLDPTEVDDIEQDVTAFVEGFTDPTFEEENPDLYDLFDLPDVEDETEEDEPEEAPPTPVSPMKEKKKEEKAPPPKIVAKKTEPKPAAKPSPPTGGKVVSPAGSSGSKIAPKIVSSPIAPGQGKSMAAVVAAHAGKNVDSAPSSNADNEEVPFEDDDAANDDTFGDNAMAHIDPKAGLADLSAMTQRMDGDWVPPPGDRNPVKPSFLQTVGGNRVPPQSQVPPQQQASTPPATQPRNAQQATSPPPAPTSSADNRSHIHKMLEISYKNLPHVSDCERQKPYSPPNPYKTPTFYPQSVHPAFNNPETFSRFDVDTLFFIFYYQQTTYQQYLAAKELKKQSWRYHKRFQTWFQRHDRPKQANDEQEQGTYIYFDYESGWTQRIKSDFVFRYQYLEDELQ